MMGLWDGSGISWTICKQSAPRSRQITTPLRHDSIFDSYALSDDAERCAVIFSRGCSHLEFINISWCCLVTDDGVRHLVSKCTNMQYFLCKGCVKVLSSLLRIFVGRIWDQDTKFGNILQFLTDRGDAMLRSLKEHTTFVLFCCQILIDWQARVGIGSYPDSFAVTWLCIRNECVRKCFFPVPADLDCPGLRGS